MSHATTSPDLFSAELSYFEFKGLVTIEAFDSYYLEPIEYVKASLLILPVHLMFTVDLVYGSAKLRFHVLSFLLNRLDAEALRYVLLEQSSSHRETLLSEPCFKAIQPD